MGVHRPDDHTGILPTPGYQQQIPPRVADAAHRDNIIDTSIVPHQAIITHLEGSPWTVRWFGNVVGQDSSLRPPQIGIEGPTVNQSYRRIEGMEIRLQGSLSHSWDEETNEMSVSGTAITYPYFLPNQHDVFFGDIGDGRTGVFILKKPEPKSYFKETVWTFDFELLGTANQDNYRDYLEEHTVERLRYSLDYLQLGRNPLMTTTAYELKQDLIRARLEIIGRFLEEFYSHEYRALILHHQGKLVYDPLLQLALTSLTNRTEHPYIARMIDRPTDECFELRVPTIWDLLIKNQQDLHYSITKKMWVLPRNAFSSYVHNHGLRYSRLDYIVYPTGDSPFCDSGGGGQQFYQPDQYDLQLHYNHFVLGGLPEPFTPHPTGEVHDGVIFQTPPNIRPVNDDDYYVLSKAFYANIPGAKSKLELVVTKMLEHERFDFEIIKDLCKDTRNWQPLDRYYYSMVLVALCNYAIKNL